MGQVTRTRVETRRRRKRRDHTTMKKAEEARRMTDAPLVCNKANHDISWFVFVFFPLPEPLPTSV